MKRPAAAISPIERPAWALLGSLIGWEAWADISNIFSTPAWALRSAFVVFRLIGEIGFDSRRIFAPLSRWAFCVPFRAAGDSGWRRPVAG
jgi:hypothetical protein